MNVQLSFTLPTQEEVRERLFNACVNQKVDAATMAVQHGGRLLCYSVDSAGKVSSVDDDALTVSASCMVKLLTATLVVQTLHERKLTLDQDIVTLLGHNAARDFPRWAGVRVRQLLNHSHGLDDLEITPYPVSSDRVDVDALYARLESAPPLAKPGTAFSYSDVGALLAGAILERLHEKNFGEILAEILLPQLSVPASRLDAGGYVCPTNGGALQMSTTDLIKLAEFHRRPDGAKPSATRADLSAMRSQPIEFSGWTAMGRRAGIGWNGFDGGWFGYNATTLAGGSLLLRFHPDMQISIAIVSKSIPAYHFLLAVFGKLLPECAQIRPPRMLNPVELNNVDVAAFAGRYETGPLAARIEGTTADTLRVTLSNRRSDRGQLLRQPIVRSLRMAENNAFFTMPVETYFLPHGQFVAGSGSRDRFEYLWNGRRLWRRVA